VLERKGVSWLLAAWHGCYLHGVCAVSHLSAAQVFFSRLLRSAVSSRWDQHREFLQLDARRNHLLRTGLGSIRSSAVAS